MLHRCGHHLIGSTGCNKSQSIIDGTLFEIVVVDERNWLQGVSFSTLDFSFPTINHLKIIVSLFLIDYVRIGGQTFESAIVKKRRASNFESNFNLKSMN